jgi:uncharacterized repeat protein (TIGR03806 family)
MAALAAGACSDDPAVSPPPEVVGRCVPPTQSNDPTTVKLISAFGGQKFTSPTELIQGPAKRFYVLEQKGVVRVVDPTGAPASTAIDIVPEVVSGGEAGLLGIAFDPRFADNGFVYLHFTAPLPTPRAGVVFQSVIARYRSSDGGATFDPASEKRLLVVDQPFANHNGGHLAFGPDGLLYISLGDGGSGGDPFGNGQNKNVLLGKLLRIDPSSGDPYGIPPTNPFAGGGGRGEVFAYGLRNTWKFSFDKETGELWGADVGQAKFEEVDRIVLGGNYGWNVREGMHCYADPNCSSEGFIDPVVEYDHSQGVSITGGYVYRGATIPALTGKFVYGDFGSGHIWAVEQTAPTSFAPLSLAETNLQISSFGQDDDGELYVVDYASGTVQKLAAADPPAAPAGVGAKLSETGCVDAKDTTKPPPGLIGYTVNSPLWSDGATKDRWLYVPQGAKIGVAPDGDFDVPPGSVAVKTFSAFGKKIETRLFVRHADATWAGYSYEWNDEQTDATLLASGKTKPLANGASWTFPSRAQCFACHTAAAGFTLGLETRQLDRDDDGKNQLERFARVLERPVASGVLSPLRAADAVGASDEERARGYLHSNCSFCHREGSGAGAATMDLRIDVPFGATKTCSVAPQGGDLGVAGAKIVAPGDPSRSTLALRMRSLDQNRMPPLATHVVDEPGLTAVESWIRALAAPCP